MIEETSRAFTFVERISEVQPGKRIRGRYHVPAHVSDFPQPLLAEATGQLAAWATMAAVDFRFRPVAGIAGKIELLGDAHPGDELELTAELENVDEESVSYHGSASVNGNPVLRLHDCIGPMLPMEGFNDPAAVRARFDQLCKTGLEGGFTALPRFAYQSISRTGETDIAAAFQVPQEAEFFADHFPRKPVFPGSLLIHVQLQLTRKLVGSSWRVRELSGIKLRAFVPPGEVLELRVRSTSQAAESMKLHMESRTKGKIVSRASVELIRE